MSEQVARRAVARHDPKTPHFSDTARELVAIVNERPSTWRL
jgi:hypothetical protein